MKKWITTENDPSENIRKLIEFDWKGHRVAHDKDSVLWEIEVNSDENLSLGFVLGPPLETKFKKGDFAYPLGEKVTVESFDFAKVNGTWEFEYTVINSRGKTSKLFQYQLPDKP